MVNLEQTYGSPQMSERERLEWQGSAEELLARKVQVEPMTPADRLAPPTGEPDMSTVGEDFPRQQARARELLTEYRKIGPVGAFGAVLIEQALRRADEAAISGDVVKVLQSYQELKALE